MLRPAEPVKEVEAVGQEGWGGSGDSGDSSPLVLLPAARVSGNIASAMRGAREETSQGGKWKQGQTANRAASRPVSIAGC